MVIVHGANMTAAAAAAQRRAHLQLLWHFGVTFGQCNFTQRPNKRSAKCNMCSTEVQDAEPIRHSGCRELMDKQINY